MNKKKSVTAETAAESALERSGKKTASRSENSRKTTAPKKTKNASNVKKSASVKKKVSQTKGRRTSKKAVNTSPVKMCSLGGLGEIGKNLTVYEYEEDMLIVDCGMAFPDDDMLGIDIVIPDFTYLEKNKERIKGIVLTHGHEDHIGALPYFLKLVNVPLYGTQLTLGLVEGKLKEHGLYGKVDLNVYRAGETARIGKFDVEFINVNHSIPDSVAYAIKTPAGVLVHTGDFKIDSNPIKSEMIDLGRFSELGKEGVLCLLSDSTNAEKPGYTMGERKVGESFDMLFQSTSAMKKRIIIATFASNIHRIQQIIDYAEKYDRKVAISGRSMLNTVTIARDMEYLNVPEGILVDISEINRFPKEKLVIITTGSQGEPMSALTRMAFHDHRQVEIGEDDFIIISATPIPGNEKTVANVVNELIKHGCEVVYEKMYDVHVSGHACQEELKMMIALTKPKYFIPVHGEHKHLQKHARLAAGMGIPEENIVLASIGNMYEISEQKIEKTGAVPSGRVFVDGLGVGDVGSIVLRDRKHLGQDGLIIIVATIEIQTGEVVSGPDIVSRGFVYVRESEGMMEQSRQLVREILNDCGQKNIKEWSAIKNRIRDELSRMLYEQTKRSPMILPIIMEI